MSLPDTTGFTLSDSFTFVQPIVEFAPDAKTMARQWLRGYQYGPIWVPPLVMPGTAANVFLALSSTDMKLKYCYALAAACIFAIAPITFLYMEPGINGALKWKVQSLLKEEGFHMKDTKIWLPHAHRHGSTQASRRWAERTEIKELILFWRHVNNFRWMLGGVAAALSGWATLSQVA
jgi:hypothetical protein